MADLKPEGALYHAVTSDTNELQQHLPEELHRQYLHELFPDLTVDANYEEEPDHHELVVLREKVFYASWDANITRYAY